MSKRNIARYPEPCGARLSTLRMLRSGCAPRSRRVLFGIWLLGFGIFFSACSLAGDVTPPPGARSVTVNDSPPAEGTAVPLLSSPPIEPVDVDKVFPAAHPSAAEGGAIFAEHCAACHGETGKGDGPRLVELMAQRTEPLPDFSKPDLASGTTPVLWFKTITEGRLDQLMPPWGHKLSEAERWNVAAFLYTLSTPPTQIELGKAIYAANCAACHGETGKGDGPEAADQKVPDFTDLGYMARVSQSDLFGALMDDVGAAPHTFGLLTEAERWAVADYVRAFSYDYAAPGAPLPEKAGVARGKVVNGTGGAASPAGLEVNLHGFDMIGGNLNLAVTLTTTTRADGAFQFEAAPYKAGRQFLLTTKYGGVTYSSDVAAFDAGQEALELPLRVYETTSDTAALRVDRFHMFLEFDGSDRVTIGQLYILSNLGDRTIAAGEGGKTFELALPSGAENVSVKDEIEGQDYFLTPEGLGDTLPIAPGAGAAQLLVSYSLPYGDKLDFAQKMLYPVEAANLLVADVAVKVSGEQLEFQGRQEFQGTEFQNFARSNLAGGESLTFQISGRPGSAAAPTGAASLTLGDSTSLALGLGAVALVLLGAGVWWRFARRSPDETHEAVSKEDLLQAIAELDDEYAAGQLDERDYAQERKELKAQLMKVWE